MIRNIYLWIWLAALAMTMTSCELIGDIFQAGFWTAIVVVVIVIVLIIWLVSRFRR